MGKPVEVVTTAKPHTIKKFELIESYVDEWARKILGYDGKNGHGGSKGLIYIDCMSNSGIYRDVYNNFIEGTALRVAKRLNTISENYPSKQCIICYNDLYPERINRLKDEINKLNLQHVKLHFSHGDCNEFLRKLNLKPYFQYNTLMLYDPYNAAINWDAITPYLNRWGEVIINHMVHDTTRGASLARKREVVERYERTYQNDISTIIEIGNNKAQLDHIIKEIIRNRTLDEKSTHYIASFPFFNRTNGLVYNLIHCSKSIEGLKLFKKVAWKTFGDKSSLKTTHETEGQLSFDSNTGAVVDSPGDEQCFRIYDIAQYVFSKYSNLGEVSFSEVYADLDKHPIFPSEGYKNDIKKLLKELYDVSFTQKTIIFKEGVAQNAHKN